MEPNSPVWSIIENLAGVVAGGAITGIVTLRGITTSANLAQKARSDRDEQEVRNLLSAIRTEVVLAWELYMLRVGASLANHDFKTQPIFEWILPIASDYLKIYNSNAGKIGAVQDARLRESIIQTYMRMEGHVNTILYHNRLLEEYGRLHSRLFPGLSPEQIQLANETKRNAELLKMYGPALQQSQFDAEKLAKNLVSELDAYLRKD